VNAGIEVVFREIYIVSSVMCCNKEQWCVFLGQGRREHRYRGGIQRIYIVSYVICCNKEQWCVFLRQGRRECRDRGGSQRIYILRVM
jgi:hypothetical protein